MLDLRVYVIGLLERRGIEFTEEDIEAILRDLKRWAEGCREPGIVRTEDGSYTLISPVYGEPYHSLTAGAVTECLVKFVGPSRILERCSLKEEVRILDVGFGLGYNTAVALTEIRKISKEVRVEVVALDVRIPEEIPPLPEPYGEIHGRMIGSLPEWEWENMRVRLVLGDARETLKKLSGFGADAVFHDPFSPFKNPELWTLDLLKLVKDTMSEEGMWTSYTSALPVRRTLLDLGFRVGESRPVGRRKGGTVASLKGEVPPLPHEEERKLLESPYSVPLRDPYLSWDPLRILVEYRISVLLRERGTA